jgi:Fic family protein
MENIEKSIQLKKELDSLRPLKKEDEQRIMQKFKLDWNYHSNHLEGNSLTYGETKALLLFGITAQGKPLKDHFEITGHNEAINWILEILHQERPITEGFIRELHKLLLKESYEVNAITSNGTPVKKRINIGAYKTTPNHVKTITGEIFYFATPEETPAKMYDLLNWYKVKIEENDFNPILLAAEFHYKFILIHPFDDGNGRTARILMNFILMQFGYPPTIIKTEDKANYFAALRQADAGILTAFVDYIAKNLCNSLELMLRGAMGGSIEDADDLDKEFALMEQKLKGLGVSSQITISKESILEIYDYSVVNTVNKFHEKLRKFEQFYLKPCFTIPDRAFEREFIVENKNKILRYKEHFLSFKYDFFELNHSTYKGLNFFSLINFNFKYKKYEVSCSKNDVLSKHKFRISKNYGEQLTPSEIDQLVNTEVRRHMEFINLNFKEPKIRQ